MHRMGTVNPLDTLPDRSATAGRRSTRLCCADTRTARRWPASPDFAPYGYSLVPRRLVHRRRAPAAAGLARGGGAFPRLVRARARTREARGRAGAAMLRRGVSGRPTPTTCRPATTSTAPGTRTTGGTSRSTATAPGCGRSSGTWHGPAAAPRAVRRGDRDRRALPGRHRHRHLPRLVGGEPRRDARDHAGRRRRGARAAVGWAPCPSRLADRALEAAERASS